MSKQVTAYCEDCKKDIDITDIPFITYADETPIVLDMQLKKPITEGRAINFLNRLGTWDWDGKPKMYHYDKAPELSHMEPGDDVHNLVVKAGYWSVE